MREPLNVHGAVDLATLARPAPAPTASAVPGGVVDATDADFQQLIQRSLTVPVVVDLWASWCQPCKTLGPILEKLAAEYGGRFLLAKVDVDANPQVAAAFQVQSIPSVGALLGGQGVPLFQGAYPEAQVRKIIDQLLAVAAQNGVTGTVAAGAPPAPAEPELPPLHAAGLAAIEAGDYAAAEASYRQALKENPGDRDAKAALAQVQLLSRLEGVGLDAAIAGAREDDIDSQLLAADAELASGLLQAAFDRLIAVVRAGGPGREPARARLVDYFEILGGGPEVARARRDLASALY